MRPTSALLRATAIALLLPASTAGLAQTVPDYERFREGVFLRYLNAREGGIDAVPRIGLSFGERVYHAVIDSGSTGIVVAAHFIPNFDQLPSVAEGRLTYSSSGREMIGRWVVAPVTLVGANDAQVTTEPMPVLAVTQVRCLRNARDCEPTDEPRGIMMVGVGFGREGDHQSQSMPDKNPLLRVTGGDGERRRGYVLTAEGVHVGLTRANTRGAFRFVKLERQADRPDWSGVPACISLNRQEPAACGSMLVDTGVTAMFMTVPPSQAGDMTGSLAEGTQVSIRLGADSASELYRFTVGDESSLAPHGTHLRTSPDRVFVNTSFHLLNGFDVLYDAEGGYAGFRRR
jgi:hypothetical protein